MADSSQLLDSNFSQPLETNNTVITMTNSANLSCYACLEIKDRMVRPCTNDKCNARICKKCIGRQVVTNNKKCGICRSPILVTSTINYGKCCESYFKVIYVLFMFTVGSSLLFLNALGKTVATGIVRCYDSTSKNYISPCDDGAVGTIFFVSLFIGIYLQGH